MIPVTSVMHAPKKTLKVKTKKDFTIHTRKKKRISFNHYILYHFIFYLKILKWQVK